MKFLVDAQLPRRLVDRLRASGHDAVHTRDLPNENRTTDREIIEQSLQDKSVVITKDQDFVDSIVADERTTVLRPSFRSIRLVR